GAASFENRGDCPSHTCAARKGSRAGPEPAGTGDLRDRDSCPVFPGQQLGEKALCSDRISRPLALLGNPSPGYGGCMQKLPHLLSVAALATGLGANGQFEAVRRAQGQLEPHVWTQVIRIDNSNLSSRYPRTVDALLFQLDSILWFYTPADGTQSLSLYRNRAEADKLNLGPLLAAIDEGFTRWKVLPPAGGPLPKPARLPNGCFIESIAILLRRLDCGAAVENPQLLSYYVARPGGVRGHTVLQFTSGGRVQVVDPDWPNRIIRISHADPNDP